MRLAAILLDNGCLLMSPPDGSVEHHQLSFVKTVLDRTGIECWVEDIYEASDGERVRVRFPEHLNFSINMSSQHVIEVDGTNIDHPMLHK